MAMLEIRALSKHFGGLAAISELDLDVNKGEILGLIGPNGAGKTTLFNVISGVYAPTRGKVIFKGEDISSAKPYQVAAKGIVRTFQAAILFQEATVLENVLVGQYLQQEANILGAIFNIPSARSKEENLQQRVMGILEFMGLASLTNELAKNLPHGHQRALAISISLAANPELLLLDEPVTGMNPTETLTMITKIQKIRDSGVTIAIVEHDMKTVMGLSDRIVVLNYGRKIAEGLPERIRENRDVIEAYLGTESGD